MAGASCQYLFFFSSRRRHTRCSRDWSSDVCSSDLFNSRQLQGVSDGIALRKITPRQGSVDDREVGPVMVFRIGPYAPFEKRNAQLCEIARAHKIDGPHLFFLCGFAYNLKTRIPSLLIKCGYV